MPTRRQNVIPPNIIYDANGLTFATWHNLQFVVWSAQGTLERCAKLEELSAVAVQAHPEGSSSVHVVIQNTPLPEAAARAKLAELTKRFAPQVACIGTVLEGSGFIVSALQSFIISIHALSNRPFKTRTCDSIAEIAKWLPPPHAKRTSVLTDSADLEYALNSVRARVDDATRVQRP